MYIFNGDIVDRGPASVECILFVFALKHRYPEFVIINRGNHEAREINKDMGFRREVETRLGIETYEAFSHSFLSLPIGVLARSEKKHVAIVHGGIPVPDDPSKAVTLAQLQTLNRRVEPVRGNDFLTQLLWNDPCLDGESRESQRGGWGCRFGPEVTSAFLRVNELHGIVRSHEEIVQPFRVTHPNCLTGESV